ncbi:MAG: NAD-dependent dihydropyrimidine dehydrogenase subunit PreA, partial [Clostridia bacterium]|nr:NAD-dependent dihydropyrimidine dehydrogenase subunit PreA [Clostridia bacterium]
MILSEQRISRSDMIRCALCADAPCDKACMKLTPSRLLRSVWFSNEQTAALQLPADNPCILCEALCERM